jgi:C4-dicarboxylate transporter DctQ subunit
MKDRILGALGAVDRGLTVLEVITVTGLLVLSVVVLSGDIAARVVFGVSVSWAAEVARYAIVWMVFVGGSIGARTGAHISIDIAVEVLPPHFARPIVMLSSLIAAASCAAISWLGYKLVMQMTMFSQKSPSLELPMWLVYSVIPASFALMAVRFVQAGLSVQMDERRLTLATSAG